MKNLVLILTSLFFIMACSKDDNTPSHKSAEYFPLTKGSTWTYGGTYLDSNGDIQSYEMIQTILEDIKLHNGNEYVVVDLNIQGFSTLNYGINEGGIISFLHFYSRTYTDSNGEQQVEEKFTEIPVFDENLSLNNSFETIITHDFDNSNRTKIKYTYLANSTSLEVEGINYTDVIEMENTEFTWNTNTSQWDETLNTIGYYAKNIGAIQHSIKDLDGNFVPSLKLKSHNVK